MKDQMEARLNRLYAVAHAGDTGSLKELLEVDQLLLERAVSTTEADDNPLHIAAVRGYAGFAKEIVHRNRNLAREVNWQGLSPLHLAAVHGHLQVAEELVQIHSSVQTIRIRRLTPLPFAHAEISALSSPPASEAPQRASPELIPPRMSPMQHESLLRQIRTKNPPVVLAWFFSKPHPFQVDGDLCYLRETKDGYLPVHIAVIKRRHDITTLLIEKCGGSLNELTYRSESLLHLAVKANCLETVQHLISLGVMQLLLNTKDGNENTCLHLSFAGRQLKVKDQWKESRKEEKQLLMKDKLESLLFRLHR